MIIRKAEKKDAGNILAITKKAFIIYRDTITTANPYFSALAETLEQVELEIETKSVFIAYGDNGNLIGSIRLSYLTPELAYISRFAVTPDEHNQGVGADLLQKAIDECNSNNIIKVALHTNSKYYRLARYYYGKGFYVHSTNFDRGYIRALFVKDLIENRETDLSQALKK